MAKKNEKLKKNLKMYVFNDCVRSGCNGQSYKKKNYFKTNNKILFISYIVKFRGNMRKTNKKRRLNCLRKKRQKHSKSSTSPSKFFNLFKNIYYFISLDFHFK